MKLAALALLTLQLAHAFVYTKNDRGEKIRWNASANVSLYVNPANENTPGVRDRDLKDALEASLASWNQTSPVKFSPIYTNALPPAGTKGDYALHH